jgi:hypothetical protein
MRLESRRVGSARESLVEFTMKGEAEKTIRHLLLPVGEGDATATALAIAFALAGAHAAASHVVELFEARLGIGGARSTSYRTFSRGNPLMIDRTALLAAAATIVGSPFAKARRGFRRSF